MVAKWSKNDAKIYFLPKNWFGGSKIGVDQVRSGRGRIEAVENWPGRARGGQGEAKNGQKDKQK